MKIMFLTVIATLCCLLTAMAQTDYFTNQKTMSGANVTYRINEKYQGSGSHLFDNITNAHTSQPMRLLNGDIAPRPFEQYKVTRIGDFVDIIKTIVLDVFTPRELGAMIDADDSIDMEFVIDHNGNIAEIGFAISDHPAFTSISPDTWYRLEQEIKRKMKYTVSDKGKSVQYVIVSNSINPNYLFVPIVPY